MPRGPMLALLFTCLSLLASNVYAILVVSQPWVRLSADQRSAEVYMELQSSEGAVLVGASSFAAARVALKLSGKGANGGKELTLPANVAVQLVPAGHRIALTKLAKPLKLGERVPLSLLIKSADGSLQELLVSAEVRRHSAVEDELHSHRH